MALLVEVAVLTSVRQVVVDCHVTVHVKTAVKVLVIMDAKAVVKEIAKVPARMVLRNKCFFITP